LRIKIVTKVNGNDVLMVPLNSQVYQFENFQDCQAASEELFRTDRVNELHRDTSATIIDLI